MEKTILVVDDQIDIRELLYDMLTKKGYKVIATHSGNEALSLIKERNPDLVLMDFSMPDATGVEILNSIRVFNQRIKVVMLTGLGTEELEKEARLAGASGFLRKNLGLDVIVKAIDQLLETDTLYKEETILVVDDNPEICSLIGDYLTKKGYSIITAGSGEEAIEKFKEHKPILIMLDIKLPGMDGIMALRRIREIDEKVGVIMITGVKDQEAFDQVKELGVFEYIVKPFDLDYLDTCVLARICIVSALVN